MCVQRAHLLHQRGRRRALPRAEQGAQCGQRLRRQLAAGVGLGQNVEQVGGSAVLVQHVFAVALDLVGFLRTALVQALHGRVDALHGQGSNPRLRELRARRTGQRTSPCGAWRGRDPATHRALQMAAKHVEQRRRLGLRERLLHGLGRHDGHGGAEHRVQLRGRAGSLRGHGLGQPRDGARRTDCVSVGSVVSWLERMS